MPFNWFIDNKLVATTINFNYAGYQNLNRKKSIEFMDDLQKIMNDINDNSPSTMN